MKLRKRIILIILLVLVFYNTGKFVYENKTLENDIAEASFYFFKEQCGIEVEEVQVSMDWMRLTKRFHRDWEVRTIPHISLIQGSLLDDGTVDFGWGDCDDYILPTIGYKLDRKEKRFILVNLP
ncbi:hypothetical protein [Caldalkalibacillus mannanilyticus]|uniref:hypothetical protein n=1 Tax=Caldalkalibacillus mannanilyticus TaxID=1418 RepID=UPI00046A59B2|nr:hypothetical protein [Caldalkalibacillus mannanilyticus]